MTRNLYSSTCTTRWPDVESLVIAQLSRSGFPYNIKWKPGNEPDWFLNR